MTTGTHLSEVGPVATWFGAQRAPLRLLSGAIAAGVAVAFPAFLGAPQLHSRFTIRSESRRQEAIVFLRQPAAAAAGRSMTAGRVLADWT